ncbi:hypothetical protein CaCOL14_010545 [Colletotrichum acutatum]
MKRWLDWAKSQKLPAFRNYPDKAARVDKELRSVFWDFDLTGLPQLADQECWQRIYSALQFPVPNPNEHYYITALNVVDCEVSRILNNGSMHQTLVDLAREAGFDARKCCDPSLSKEQRQYKPPKGPEQVNSANALDLEAFSLEGMDMSGPLNYAAIAGLFLQPKTIKANNEAAAAARDTPASAVPPSTGNEGGSHRCASPSSFVGSRTEPKTLAQIATVDENSCLKPSRRPSSIQEPGVAGRLSSEGTIRNITDQAAQPMSNDTDSKTTFNGFVIPKRQRGGSVQQDRGIAAARPESRSATSTASGGGCGSRPALSKQPPAGLPLHTQRTSEQQSRRESSGSLSGALPQHGALVRRPSGTKGSGLLTPSTPLPQAPSGNTQQHGSLVVKTESQERSASLAEHKTASQIVGVSTQGSTTQGQAITAAMTKKLEETINQHLLIAIRGVYRSVPKLIEGKIRGWLDGQEYRSMGFAVLRDVESETTKTVNVRDTKRKADEKDAEGGDESQQAAKRQRGDGVGSGCTT